MASCLCIPRHPCALAMLYSSILSRKPEGMVRNRKRSHGHDDFKFTLFTRGDASKAVLDLKRFVDDNEAEYMFEALEREAIMINVSPSHISKINNFTRT